MSNQIRRTALVTVALALMLNAVGCAQFQKPASNKSGDTNPYEQTDKQKKSLYN